MKYALSLIALFSLVACGVDGEPTTPTKTATTKPGVTIAGRAEVGVAKSW